MSKQKTLENYDKDIWFCKCSSKFYILKGTAEAYCPKCGGYCSDDFWNQDSDIVMEILLSSEPKAVEVSKNECFNSM